MEMKAIADHWGTIEGSLLALRAGVDIVCISHHVNLGVAAIELVEQAIEAGTLDVEELKVSTQKILKIKEALKEISVASSSVIGQDEHTLLNRQLHEQSITLVNDVPFDLGERVLYVGPRPFRATNASDDGKQVLFGTYLSNLLGGDQLLISDHPVADEITKVVQRAKEYDSVVLGTYNGHLFTGQIELANAIGEVTPLTVFALRNPYDLSSLNPEIRSYAAWAYTPMVFEAISKIITGEIEALGHLPIHLGGRSNA